MIRTQIQLTQEQAQALRRIAAERGVSIAGVIRDAVQRAIQEDERREKWRRASELAGRYHDTKTDVSVNHDAYLDQAYL